MKNEQLSGLLEPVIEALGLECLGIEYVAHRSGGLLRIYIDHPQGAQREVTLHDCEAVSREVSAVLDLEDPIAGRYSLEVSSPGFERPLFKLEHFSRFVGQVAKVHMSLPVGGRRRFQGVIEGVRDGRVLLRQEGSSLALEHAHVQKANLVPEYEDARAHKPGKGSKPGKRKAGPTPA